MRLVNSQGYRTQNRKNNKDVSLEIVDGFTILESKFLDHNQNNFHQITHFLSLIEGTASGNF